MTELSGAITTTIAGFSDVGTVRSNNEDNFLIADLKTGRVYLIPQKITHKVEENRLMLAVSDGVGGANSGEIASSMAVHSMRVELLRKTKTAINPFERLVQAVEKANSLIWAEGQSNPGRRGMGATITAALVEKNVAYVAEVGDSRGYIIHSGRIKQITTDQSLVGILVERGLMSPEQAETAPGRNIILQSLGCQAEIKVAVTSLELTAGDYLLLCSDGLSGKVRSEEMIHLAENCKSLEIACKEMIELAKQRGGEDNITVILAKFEGDGLKPPEYVARLTTHIEILAAFDPEAVGADRKSKKEPAAAKEPVSANRPAEDKSGSAKPETAARSTKEFKSNQGGSEQVYMNTISVSEKILPVTQAQMMQVNADVKKNIADLLVALAEQLSSLQKTLNWAEKTGKQTSQIADSIKNTSQLIKILEAQKSALDDANRIFDHLTN